MRIFKPAFIGVGVLWAIALLLGVIDLAGPGLGAPPTSTRSRDPAAASAAPTPVPTPPPVPTASPGSNNTRKKETKPAQPKEDLTGAGPLYPLTRNIPVAVSQGYANYHFYYFPVPILASFLLWRRISRLKKAQLARQAELASSSVTLLLGAQSDDTTAWPKTWPFLVGLYNMLTSIPHNEPKNRYSGYGLAVSLGLVSRVGDKIRLTVRVPVPKSHFQPHAEPGTAGKKETTAAEAEKSENAVGVGEKEKPAKINTKARKGSEGELSEIPDGFTTQIANQLISKYPWCEVETLPPGEDLLDLDSYAKSNATYQEYRRNIEQPVRGWQLLALNKPDFLPIRTEFDDTDPTAILYQQLDTSRDSALLACGIEIVLVPATSWRKDAERLVGQLQANEMGQGAASKQAMRGGTGAGAKAVNPSGAASSLKSAQGARARREALEQKLSRQASFATHIYVWAEGSEAAVKTRLKQVSDLLCRQYDATRLSAGSGTGAGTAFRVVGSGQSLAEVRQRRYPIFFEPEPSILTPEELIGLWHLPSQAIKHNAIARAGAMSPEPELDLIDHIKMPDGRILRTDTKFRRIIGIYKYPDGREAYIGVTEEGAKRGFIFTGLPGSGKSVIGIEIIAVQHIERADEANVGKGGSKVRGDSVVIFDPNEDASKDFMDRVRDDLEELVIWFDPLDPDRVPGINPLAVPENLDSAAINEMLADLGLNLPADLPAALRQEYSELVAQSREEQKAKGSVRGAIASRMMDIMAATQRVDMDTTPNIFRVLSNAFRLAVEVNSTATLWTVKRIITDAAYRQAMLRRSSDQMVREFFENDMENVAKKDGSGITPTISRLEGLLRQEVVRYLFAQARQTVNLATAMNKGQIMVFTFSPDLGKDQKFILTTAFMLIKQGIFSRTSTAAEARRPTVLAIDEFQTAVGSNPEGLVTFLEQGRKFGGEIILLHQYMDQIGPLQKAVKGTVGSQGTMILSPDDQQYYGNYFDTSDYPKSRIKETWANLPPFSQVSRLYDNGRVHRPVLLRSPKRPPRLPNAEPVLIAILDDTQPEGYRLEAYHHQPQPQQQTAVSQPELERKVGEQVQTQGQGLNGDETGQPNPYAQTLQIHTASRAWEGFWEPSAKGLALGVRPLGSSTTNMANYKGLTRIIEALTRYLFQLGQIRWYIRPLDFKEAEVMGLTEQMIQAINGDGEELAKCWQLLLELEALPHEARQKALVKLNDLDWALYRASRYGRDLVLAKLVLQNPGLIPNKRDRIRVHSSLRYATPIPEVEAEAERPDLFSREAEQIREELIAAAEMEEEAGISSGLAGGRGARKKMTV